LAGWKAGSKGIVGLKMAVRQDQEKENNLFYKSESW
jgi:hypothetical protein